jgi:titin
MPVIRIDGAMAGSGAICLNLTASASGSTLNGLSVTGFSGGGVLVNGASHVSITNDDVGLVQLTSGVFVHGNSAFGVELAGGANQDTLSCDVVSGQSGNGVVIAVMGTNLNTVQNCQIGTDPTANAKADHNGASLANSGDGVVIEGGTTNNRLTGDVVSDNSTYGVFISDVGTMGNVIQGCSMGTNAAGSAALPNYVGVAILNGATNNTIGGTTTATRDVISGNAWDGVHLASSGTTGNVVEGDYIGVTASGTLALGNGASDVAILSGASKNVIGGSASGTADVISAGGV